VQEEDLVNPSRSEEFIAPSLAKHSQQQFRILCVGETWFGSDARAAFAALRRLGHSIQVVDQNNYVPLHWQTKLSKAIRKAFRPLFVKELMLDVYGILERSRPHCLFVFKGNWVHPEIIKYCRSLGIATVNYYPDVSFLSHGPYIPQALPLYDQIFNTKSYGVGDMQSQLGVRKVNFLEPGYDPELHRPVSLTNEERKTYGCDVAFIGTWSPKKESILLSLRKALPNIRIRIWGFQWDRKCAPALKGSVMGYGITGDEYTKAICGSAICLGLLSEIGLGSSSGDLITARTFQIPACGTFMLHERNPEVLHYFEEGRDAEFFDSSEELARKVNYYLSDERKREEIAKNGLLRSNREDYSIDNRMSSVLFWLSSQLNGSSTPAAEGLL
jgi:spore maturation protein CgeB